MNAMMWCMGLVGLTLLNPALLANAALVKYPCFP